METQQDTTRSRPDRILVVDDELAVQNVVATLLQRRGYEAGVACDSAQALSHLRDDPGCDLVLTDVSMPGGDGLLLLDIICRDYPGVPVVMLTGLQDISIAIDAFRSGAVDYLLKPFGRAQLDLVVDRALEHGRMHKQGAAYLHNLQEIIAARTNRLRQTMLELERSYDFTLEAMGDALDLRDADTEGHSRRVTAYTIALAREMGVKTEELRTIARGAFLHDIGKIATPDRILLKPGKLDAEETEIMRQHCARGYEMVRKIPFLREAAEIVYTHQETYDGSGYPRGLREDQIPLGARIFAIADTLDAVTSDRPYRKGRSFADARAEIVRCAGTQFDPGIVKVFLAIPEEVWNEARHDIGHGYACLLGLQPQESAGAGCNL